MLLGVSRSRLWLSRMKRGRGTPTSRKKATDESAIRHRVQTASHRLPVL
jgi:hypothetical protein